MNGAFSSMIHRGVRIVAVLLAIGPGLPLAWSQTPRNVPKPSDNWTDTERWVWSRLVSLDRNGPANLFEHCPDTSLKPDTSLNPENEKDTRWQNPCRTVSARFLRDVLANEPWQAAIPHDGVAIYGARIVGKLDLENTRLTRAFWIGRSRIECITSDCGIDLLRAHTDSMIGVMETFVEGDFGADALQSDSDVLLRSGSIFKKDINLNRARIAGQLDMTGANLDGTLSAQGIQVYDLFLRSETVDLKYFPASVGENVSLRFARIGNTLDLRGAILPDFDLSGGSIAGDIQLGTRTGGPTEWRTKNNRASTLTLRNTIVGYLADQENAWPKQGHLDLDGFTFAHLGGASGQSGTQLRDRGMKWWDAWARLGKYTPTPYGQLAKVLSSTGDQGAANQIRFLGSQRARESAWENRAWARWFGLSLLRVVTGYGIGRHTFLVLVWVFTFAFIGAVLLYSTVPNVQASPRGRLWCFGASLSRLLPVIEINKEFSEFFHDPQRERLNAWQAFAFDFLAVIGWVLGGLLIAAMASLTQIP